MLKADSFILQNTSPERVGKLVLILVPLALDGIHQIPNAMSFRIHNLPDVLSLEETVALRADSVAVQVTKRFARIATRVRKHVQGFDDFGLTLGFLIRHGYPLASGICQNISIVIGSDLQSRRLHLQVEIIWRCGCQNWSVSFGSWEMRG